MVKSVSCQVNLKIPSSIALADGVRLAFVTRLNLCNWVVKTWESLLISEGYISFHPMLNSIHTFLVYRPAVKHPVLEHNTAINSLAVYALSVMR